MTKELTPEALTFISFHHSQGNFPLQIAILGYMEQTTGVTPNLIPLGQERERYINCISSGVDSHIPFANDGLASQMVDNTFNDLYMAWRSEGGDFKRLSRDQIVTKVVSGILSVENKILDLEAPWTSERGGGQDIRRQRLAERVKMGRSSFLYYYGGDSGPAGHDTFNAMYSEVWQQVKEIQDNPNHEPFMADMIREHQEKVMAAEIAFLGHTILAHTTTNLAQQPAKVSM